MCVVVGVCICVCVCVCECVCTFIRDVFASCVPFCQSLWVKLPEGLKQPYNCMIVCACVCARARACLRVRCFLCDK